MSPGKNKKWLSFTHPWLSAESFMTYTILQICENMKVTDYQKRDAKIVCSFSNEVVECSMHNKKVCLNLSMILLAYQQGNMMGNDERVIMWDVEWRLNDMWNVKWRVASLTLQIMIFGCYHTDKNKAGYTATKVACGWAGAIFEVTRPFGQEQWGQKIKIIKK